MAAEVDGVRVHVDVHEIVHNLALDVVLHPVDQESAAHIHDLDEGEAPAGVPVPELLDSDSRIAEFGVKWRKPQSWREKLDCFSLVVAVGVQRLVCHLVALDSLEKVIHDPLPVSLRVVRTGHFHFLPKTFSTFN